MNKYLENAVRTLKNGGIIIFPTDTAYGIGCRIDKTESVEKLFKIRRRPRDKAVPVLASSIEMVEKYVGGIEPDVADLMRKYWPGALTLVLPSNTDKVPNLVRGGGDTIGFRVPNHRTTLDMIRKVGTPILAPSANFSEGPTPFRQSDLDSRLSSLVDMIVPGRCSVKNASTVVDCTVKPWVILRQGAVKLTINQLIK